VVGVKLPTLYHFFGSKQGLIDAVVEHGFDLYLGEKSAMESTGDPIQDIRVGWDAHVAFGLANPGFYALMYGTVRPGYVPQAQERPRRLLDDLVHRAHRQGRLAVPPGQATAHVLAANVGVTLRQIALDTADPDLSNAMREATIAAVTVAGNTSSTALRTAIEVAAARGDVLGRTETRLLIEWLTALGDAGDS
jgi:AcrR family transcriptional regulator